MESRTQIDPVQRAGTRRRRYIFGSPVVARATVAAATDVLARSKKARHPDPLMRAGGGERPLLKWQSVSYQSQVPSEGDDEMAQTRQFITSAGAVCLISVPSTLRNAAIHAGCAGQAGPVTRFPSVYAPVIGTSANVPPAARTSGATAG